MNRTMLRIQVGVGVAFGFGAGLALMNKVIEGGKTDWLATGLLGWGILAGTAVGFLAGCLMMHRLKHWLTTRTTPWILLGCALGPLCAVVIQVAFWDVGSPFLGITSGIGSIGLWNGMLLGFAFENVSPTTEPSGR